MIVHFPSVRHLSADVEDNIILFSGGEAAMIDETQQMGALY